MDKGKRVTELFGTIQGDEKDPLGGSSNNPCNRVLCPTTGEPCSCSNRRFLQGQRVQNLLEFGKSPDGEILQGASERRSTIVDCLDRVGNKPSLAPLCGRMVALVKEHSCVRGEVLRLGSGGRFNPNACRARETND